jgi:dCMP deaminase
MSYSDIQSDNNYKTDQENLQELGFKNIEFLAKPGDAIKHEDFLMSLACLTALRSPDSATKVGACIVNEYKRIVGLGFNDLPHRCIEQTSFNHKYKIENLKEKNLNIKNLYMCHAAESAILNKNSSNLRNCSLYTNILPCNECMKLIVQSGIKKIFFLKEKIDNNWEEIIKASKVISILCGIECIQYEFKRNPSVIQFKSREKFLKFDDAESLIKTQNSEKNEYYPDFMKQILTLENHLNQLKERDYYMFVAQLASLRSKDPEKQVGACIVDKNGKIISIGYNGFPNNRTEVFPWDENNEKKTVNSKHMYVCHAELNAIVSKYDSDISGCVLYQTLYPCINCARLIIQSGIKEIYYYEFDEKMKKNIEFMASKELFEMYGIKCEPYKPSIDEADITKVIY